jgi:metal-responsive CopG/Arc/MetJ family transcriptional regulator
METISLKMEGKLLHEIDSMIRDYRYSTRTEFIRDAIRTKLNELEKEEAIRNLVSMKNDTKAKNLAKKLNLI